MKKIMFAAIAALAITSCSQNEEFEAPSQKAEISFNTAVGKAPRATPMLSDDFDNFKVYAYNTGDSKISAVETLPETAFMPGVEVEKKNEVWGFSNVYYWPLTDNLQFFSYSPMGSDALTDYTAAAKYPSFVYTVKDTPTAQEDLLAAVATDQTKQKSGSGIVLTFKHLLTQINFSAKGATLGYKYNVSKIEIAKVHSKATFTYADGAASVGSWGVANTPITNPYEYAGQFTEISGGGVDATSFSKPDNALMLMPQTLPAESKITVTYSVIDNNNAKIFEGPVDIDLAGAVWEAGKNLRYTLVLADNGVKVSFIPDVSEWGNSAEGPLAPVTPEGN